MATYSYLWGSAIEPYSSVNSTDIYVYESTFTTSINTDYSSMTLQQGINKAANDIVKDIFKN